MNPIDTISREDVVAAPLLNPASCAPADPLALDPLGPIAPRDARAAAIVGPSDPLALDPLSPLVAQPSGGRGPARP